MKTLTEEEKKDFEMIFRLAEDGISYGMNCTGIREAIEHSRVIVDGLFHHGQIPPDMAKQPFPIGTWIKHKRWGNAVVVIAHKPLSFVFEKRHDKNGQEESGFDECLASNFKEWVEASEWKKGMQ
jgi:hypothetical protein